MIKESLYKRYEPAVTADCELDSRGYWFVFSANKVLMKTDPENLSIPYSQKIQDLKLLAGSAQYLGTLQGQPCYCAAASLDFKAPDGMSFYDLRSLYGAVEDDIFLLAGKAIQIVAWDLTHQYCGRCGAPVEELQGERAKKCPNCGFISYPRISPATITAIIRDNKILLAHARAYSSKIHSLIAGFLEPGETLEECVQREIMEEVGLKVKNIKYFGSQPWPFPNSMMIGFTAEYESGEISVDGAEISDADWYDADHLPELPPKLSIAREIIDWYVHSTK